MGGNTSPVQENTLTNSNSEYKMLIKTIGLIFGIIGVIVIFSLLYSIPIWLLWNWLMPLIFNLPKITLLQALGMALLAELLFGDTPSKTIK